ncbi:hypothetical protein [Veillonella parvula]
MRSLEELYLQCRNKSSKVHILEAINCYKGGAYRACIVATWIALVYDFIEKLNELALTKDREAIQLQKDIENNRISNNIDYFLKFERELLKRMSEKFELLSPVECKILERLSEDRNLCAHPSMVAENTAFKATAELARYHIINVIEFVLSRPPVQGKAALDSIFEKVNSSYFPSNQDEIHTILLEGPLGRAKASLKRQFLKRVLIECMSIEIENPAHHRYLNILAVFCELNKEFVIDEIPQYFSSILEKNDKETFTKFCEILNGIPDLYQCLNETHRICLSEYILRDAPVYIVAALDQVPELSGTIFKRIKSFENKQLLEFIMEYPLENPISQNLEYSINRLIDSFKNARGYREAESCFRDILYFTSRLKKDDLKRIVEATLENVQISGAYGIGEMYLQLFENIDLSIIDRSTYEQLKDLDFYEDVLKVIAKKSEK